MNRKWICKTWQLHVLSIKVNLGQFLGSWTLDNYKLKLQAMEEEKLDRAKLIEKYLQNQQHEIDKGLFLKLNV